MYIYIYISGVLWVILIVWDERVKDNCKWEKLTIWMKRDFNDRVHQQHGEW